MIYHVEFICPIENCPYGTKIITATRQEIIKHLREHDYSILLRQHLEMHGIIGKDENGFLVQKEFKKKNGDKKKKKLSSINEEELNGNNERYGEKCTNCGSRNTIMTGGCKEPTCMDCGHGVCG